MGDDDISSGLLFMAVGFDFHSTKVSQLSNQNPYVNRFWSLSSLPNNQA